MLIYLIVSLGNGRKLWSLPRINEIRTSRTFPLCLFSPIYQAGGGDSRLLVPECGMDIGLQVDSK